MKGISFIELFAGIGGFRMNRKKRERIPRIKPSIRQLIVSEATRYREKPRLALASKLKDTIERMGEASPSEETMLKIISEARNKEKSPVDNPWYLGTMKDYPLPPEVIPYLFLVQSFIEKFVENHPLAIRAVVQFLDKLGNPPPDTPLTIRQAIWISRLYSTIDISKLRKEKDKTLAAVYFLWCWATAYSALEFNCHISNVDFDSTKLDKAFRKEAESWIK